MIDDLIPFDKVEGFVLKRSSFSVPSNLRYFKKIGFLLLVLELCSHRKKASMLKLQFFNWAFSKDENLAFLSNIIEDKTTLPEHAIHLDPSVNKAIEYAISDEFLKIDKNGKVEIDIKGATLVNRILTEKDSYKREISQLSNLKKSLSEQKLEQIFKKIKW